MRALSLAGFASIALALSGCELEHPPSIGVSLSDDGQAIVIHYKPCRADALIYEVRLQDAKGTYSNGADDETLWFISSLKGTRDRKFKVGASPEGYDELVHLDAVPSTESLLRVSVATSELRQGESYIFRAANLRAGALLVDGKWESECAFLRRNACG